MLEKLFKLSEHGTNVKKELIAGLITFLTMSYVLIVNPVILGETGMDKAALFTSTAIACVAGTLLMAFLANIPIALGPGMGLNSFFASTVVLTMGYSWQFALTAVFIEGLIFIVLTALNVRKVIMDKMPKVLKSAIPVGVGIFIAFIGLQQSGLIVRSEHTMLTLGSLADRGVWVTLAGLLVTGISLARNIPGAILIGILTATVFGLFLGITRMPESNLIALPPNISPIFAKFEWTHIFSFDMLIVVFTFLFVNLFDTVGTLIGVASKAGLLDKNKNLPQAKKAFYADSLATTFGAIIGTSTITAYVESTAGVASGGRTGLTSVGTAMMFFLAIFFAPVFLLVPIQATATALIIVGLFMLSSVVEINFNDFTESVPAFLTIIMMPFAYSIAQGIIFGILGFVLIKTFSGRAKEVSAAVYVVAALFLIKIITDYCFV
ncbi:MAG: NCS2 family permease [Dysgonamonadaceae bacterium]|jgi:AGZA family xanthine/uracil permease-like MFS transporter|nr:NCS2 family permease [Dysgonamonadaceae bacterium]